jgi:peptide subunit release factor 1 (eRF1)
MATKKKVKGYSISGLDELNLPGKSHKGKRSSHRTGRKSSHKTTKIYNEWG